jgi:phage protein U
VYEELRRGDSYMFVKSERFTATTRAGSRQYTGSKKEEVNRMNGADGISDIEGKAARVAASECGQRASFNGADL